MDQYVRAESDELDTQKLPDLLELKYGSVADAKPEIGNVATIREFSLGCSGSLWPLAV